MPDEISRTEKFFIGAVGGIAPAIIMMTKSVDWEAIPAEPWRAAGIAFAYLALAGLTGFVATLYDETNRLKVFWIGVTLPSLVLNAAVQVDNKRTSPGSESTSSSNLYRNIERRIELIGTVYAASDSSLSGTVSDLKGKCPNLQLKIQRKDVHITKSTRFGNMNCEEVREGAAITAQGKFDSKGALIATEISRAKLKGFDQFLEGIRQALGRR